MKIIIVGRDGELNIKCEKLNVQDGMLIIYKPEIKDKVSVEETWIPISQIVMLHIIEKNKD